VSVRGVAPHPAGSARADRREVGAARETRNPDALLELREEGCQGGRGGAPVGHAIINVGPLPSKHGGLRAQAISRRDGASLGTRVQVGDGRWMQNPWYVSKEACEAAAPAVLKEHFGHDGHCIEWKDGHLIGSQAPAQAGK
jgi:hypothetical protein